MSPTVDSRFPISDFRLVPARAGRAEIRERASRFLAFAFRASGEKEASEAVSRLRREYHDANHVAFAWKIGSGDTARKRASDSGEPSGTAGKPIASAIESAGVTDVLVAVVRYFGGTKLGTGGLSRAYREAASEALSAAGVKRMRETRLVRVRCPFDRLGVLRRLMRPQQVTLDYQNYSEQEPELCLAVAPSRLPTLLAALSEARLEHVVE